MNNITVAEFSRLFKNRIFYISLIISAAIGAYFPITNLIIDLKDTPDRSFLAIGFDYSTISPVPFIFLSTVFTVLFIGREFGNGTIANKLISGHSRFAVYASYFTVCSTAGIMMGAVFVLSDFIFKIISYGILYLNSAKCVFLSSSEDIFNITFNDIADEPGTVYFYPDMDWDFAVKFWLTGIIIIAVYCSLILMIAMITQSKARIMIVSLIAVIALIVWGEIVASKVMPVSYDLLNETETYEEYLELEEELRGESLSGAKKAVMLFLDDLNPYNQTLTFFKGSAPKRTNRFVIYDLGLIAVFSVSGIIIFNKKDLKSGVQNE